MKDSSKKKSDANKSEGNIYDRIFKENAETLFIPLIEKELKLEIKSYKILRHKFPKTIEREVDFLYEAILNDNTKLLLHIEFQTSSDKNMIFRMGMYHGLAFSLYKLPIKHIVVFLGKGKSKMRNVLKPEEIFTGFDIINVNTLNTEELISSQIPEVILLALLSNYKNERSEAILRLILKNLKKYSKSKSELLKYQQQLIILARLRKLEQQTIKIVEDMPITYDIETDYLYNTGIKEGEVKGIELSAKVYKLYVAKKSIKEISEIVGLAQKEVRAIIAKFQ